MLIRFSSISISKYIRLFVKAFTIVLSLYLLSCDEAEYKLDNPFDPENMDLNPPALFFHPFEISTVLGSPISVELYGLELLPAAAAHLDVRYDWGSLAVDSIVPGPFFLGDNQPIEIAVDEQGTLDIFIYYLPDVQSDQSDGGTLSLATIHFSTISTGESELLFGPNTVLRDFNNEAVIIKGLGSGYINVD